MFLRSLCGSRKQIKWKRMKSKLAKNINRNKSKYLCSMQAASTSTLTLSLSLSPSPSLSATPRRARHGRTCAKYLDVSFYFGAGAARVGGSSLICILSALQKERERERQWQRESERQRVRQIERVRKTGNFRLLQLQKFTGNLRERDARLSRWSPLWGTTRCRWRYWQCWRSCHTSKCRVLARRLINMYESP